MKFCPFCGASVLDDTVSFCSECGKSLSISAKQTEEKEPSKPTKKPTKKKGSDTPPHLKKKKLKNSNPEPPEPSEEVTKAEDGYDGYYDDIVPTDTGKPREGIDWVLMKKIGLIGAAVVIIICLCIAAMYLL